MDAKTITVDRERLWRSLMDMAAIGALANGGCCRLALSDEDKAGRDAFVVWCREAGLKVSVDRAGNIFARRAGADADAPAVMCGSHLDTQPHGGKFDGVYGVLAGLEVVRALNDAGARTRAPIDVAVWSNEEGARFSPGLTGSAAFAGALPLADALATAATDGARFGDELARIGYAGHEAPGGRAVAAFFEAHIEQGPILERERRVIGAVTHIQGMRWFTVSVTGVDSHAGTTPMDARRDALVGASAMVLEIDRLARAHAPDARITVGRLEVSPNSGNTVPGQVVFTIDLRHPDSGTLDDLENLIRAGLERRGRDRRVEVVIEKTLDTAPVAFDGECVAAVRRSAERLGYAHMDMISGAGHDSLYLAKAAPTAMIFVPCEAGLSHNERENATPDDLAAGCNVLLHVMLERAGLAA